MRASRSRVSAMLKQASEAPLEEALRLISIVMTNERGAFRAPAWTKLVEKDKRFKLVVAGMRLAAIQLGGGRR